MTDTTHALNDRNREAGRILDSIQSSTHTRFEDAHRVMSFSEFMQLTLENPQLMCRNAVTYLFDAIRHFGYDDETPSAHRSSHFLTKPRRYKIFDQSFLYNGTPVRGQEAAQNELMDILSSFVSTGKADKAVMLYGPNGSAKSSLIKCLFTGLEAYSQSPQGALFHFSWVFPQEILEKLSMGIGLRESYNERLDSYADVAQAKIGAILRSELHENPLFLIPKEDRQDLFETWIKAATRPEQRQRLCALEEHFLNGALGHKNELIFQALLDDCNGDFSKVMKYIRIERFYLSKRFRKGLVSIEPQFSIDATMRQVTLDRSLSNLPPALHSLNLFQLEGDLVDGNRGIIEYNDILKRPIEHFKYLLSTTESSTFNLGNVLVFLDSIFLATTNDRQLEAFRQHPEFYSFKARIELVRVPYLLKWDDEEKIYQKTARDLATKKELVPHTTHSIALWAILTRLKRPILQNKSTALVKILERINPVEKAELYNSAKTPSYLSSEERTELNAHLAELYNEHSRSPHYEGLLGASARELKIALQIAAQNPKYSCISPLAIFAELRKLIDRKTDYDYLRLEPNHGYHDYPYLLSLVENEWLSWVDEEVKSCLDLSDEARFSALVNEYIQQVTHKIRGEKIKNKITGKSEEASVETMRRFEKMVQVKDSEVEEFRQSLMGRLGAWKLENRDHPAQVPLPLDRIFSDLLRKMHHHFYEDRKVVMQKIGDFLAESGDTTAQWQRSESDAVASVGVEHAEETASRGEAKSPEREGKTLARQALEGLQNRFAYGPRGAQEVLVDLIKKRYR